MPPFIGGKNKLGKPDRDVIEKTLVIDAVEARPKGGGHIALLKRDEVSADDASKFLDSKSR